MRIFIVFSLFLIGNTFAVSGQSTSLITSHIKFTKIPLKRQNFKTAGAIKRYRLKQYDEMIHEFYPQLSKLEILVNRYINMGIGFESYDPANKSIFYTKELFKSSSFPLNVKFNLNAGKVTMYQVEIAFKSFVPDDLVTQLTNDLTQFVSSLPKYAVTKSKFSKTEELKIPLKLKTFEFYKFQDYFAVQLKQEVLIDQSYFKEYRASLNRLFIKYFDRVKSEFMASHKIKTLVNQKSLLNLQEAINTSKLNRASDAFKSSTVLSKDIIRRNNISDGLQYTYLLRTKEPDSPAHGELFKILNRVN